MIRQGTCSSQKPEKESAQSDPWFLPEFDSGEAANNQLCYKRQEKHIINYKQKVKGIVPLDDSMSSYCGPS